MLPRTLEPELAVDEAEAELYHEMDHVAVNEAFLDDLWAGGTVGPRLIDLGCGPAAILIQACERDDSIHAMGLDLDVAMLDIARREIEIAGVIGRVSLQQADLKAMSEFDAELAETVISNTVAHHLPHPEELIATAKRLVTPGGRVFVRDLLRPADEHHVESLVTQHAGEEPQLAQQLLRQSLHAALNLDEVRSAAENAEIPPEAVSKTSDRHWTLDWTKS